MADGTDGTTTFLSPPTGQRDPRWRLALDGGRRDGDGAAAAAATALSAIPAAARTAAAPDLVLVDWHSHAAAARDDLARLTGDRKSLLGYAQHTLDDAPLPGLASLCSASRIDALSDASTLLPDGRVPDAGGIDSDGGGGGDGGDVLDGVDSDGDASETTVGAAHRSVGAVDALPDHEPLTWERFAQDRPQWHALRPALLTEAHWAVAQTVLAAALAPPLHGRLFLPLDRAARVARALLSGADALPPAAAGAGALERAVLACAAEPRAHRGLSLTAAAAVFRHLQAAAEGLRRGQHDALALAGDTDPRPVKRAPYRVAEAWPRHRWMRQGVARQLDTAARRLARSIVSTASTATASTLAADGIVAWTGALATPAYRAYELALGVLADPPASPAPPRRGRDEPAAPPDGESAAALERRIRAYGVHTAAWCSRDSETLLAGHRPDADADADATIGRALLGVGLQPAIDALNVCLGTVAGDDDDDNDDDDRRRRCATPLVAGDDDGDGVPLSAATRGALALLLPPPVADRVARWHRDRLALRRVAPDHPLHRLNAVMAPLVPAPATGVAYRDGHRAARQLAALVDRCRAWARADAARRDAFRDARAADAAAVAAARRAALQARDDAHAAALAAHRAARRQLLRDLTALRDAARQRAHDAAAADTPAGFVHPLSGGGGAPDLGVLPGAIAQLAAPSTSFARLEADERQQLLDAAAVQLRRLQQQQARLQWRRERLALKVRRDAAAGPGDHGPAATTAAAATATAAAVTTAVALMSADAADPPADAMDPPDFAAPDGEGHGSDTDMMDVDPVGPGAPAAARDPPSPTALAPPTAPAPPDPMVMDVDSVVDGSDVGDDTIDGSVEGSLAAWVPGTTVASRDAAAPAPAPGVAARPTAGPEDAETDVGADAAWPLDGVWLADALCATLEAHLLHGYLRRTATEALFEQIGAVFLLGDADLFAAIAAASAAAAARDRPHRAIDPATRPPRRVAVSGLPDAFDLFIHPTPPPATPAAAPLGLGGAAPPAAAAPPLTAALARPPPAFRDSFWSAATAARYASVFQACLALLRAQHGVQRQLRALHARRGAAACPRVLHAYTLAVWRYHGVLQRLTFHLLETAVRVPWRAWTTALALWRRRPPSAAAAYQAAAAAAAPTDAWAPCCRALSRIASLSDLRHAHDAVLTQLETGLALLPHQTAVREALSALLALAPSAVVDADDPSDDPGGAPAPRITAHTVRSLERDVQRGLHRLETSLRDMLRATPAAAASAYALLSALDASL